MAMGSEALRMDAFVEGGGIRRGVEVRATAEALLCDDVCLPYGDVIWLSRRAGMLLVFADRLTLAIRGSARGLERLYEDLADRIDLAELRRRIVRQLGHEVVLFTAGCAASGTIDGRSVGGLYVAAATRRALYLLNGDRLWSLAWPARAARRRPARSAERGDGESDYLVLSRGDTSLTIRYLFPEELGAVLFAASREPPQDGRGGPLELFSRKEVSPPPPAGLPEFSLAAGSLQEVAERAAANVPGDLQSRSLLPPFFFQTHFLELGETALGPLLLRKSAASTADSLHRAVEAMNAGGLQADTRAAVATAADRLLAVYQEELERLLALKRVRVRSEREFAVSAEEREQLGVRMQAPFERLWFRFEDLGAQEAELLHRLAELDEGPPDQDDGQMREAAQTWRATMNRLDRGFEGAWRELVEEIEKTWSTRLLPRLAEASSAERRRVPEWVQLTVLGAVTLLLAAIFVVFIL